MKKIFCLLTLPVLLLTSCNLQAIDFSKKPNDFPYPFWLADIINESDIDESLIYKKTFSTLRLLDSNYSFVIAENGEKKLPQKYVLYTFSPYKDEKIIVNDIRITDPKVSIYGLSMNTNERIVNQRLISYGFIYAMYSGMDNSYFKDNYEIRIYSSYIDINYRFKSDNSLNQS